MNTCLLILLIGLLPYVRSAPTGWETVWLKDMTTGFQTEKRIVGDDDLPYQLAFHLRRGSHDLTLNLKRNYDIDPNAEINFIEKLKDGRSILRKTTNLEKEAVAYYQDMENGAFMTVRCAKRANHKCDRVINGNIQIGDSCYDIRPAEADVTSEELLDVQDLEKRYLLLDIAHLELDNLVYNTDAAKITETKAQEELKSLLQRFNGKEKQTHFRLRDASLSSRNVANVHDRGLTDTTRQLKQDYYVKVVVLVDSGVWDLYSSMVNYGHHRNKHDEVARRIRQAYSHIINGVNLRYKTIEDQSISISVIPHNFIMFQDEKLFPHNRSKVVTENGKTYIDAHNYLDDLSDWDKGHSGNQILPFDHAMLFTTHDLYKNTTDNNLLGGVSFLRGVCETGSHTSVIESRHYVKTVQTATHELGHNLGAQHDGEGDAADCKSEDLFIMTSKTIHISESTTYIKNYWIFSTCSVRSFIEELQYKQCVKNKGTPDNEDEWFQFMKDEAGDVFTPSQQCYIVYGPGSVFYGDVSEDICYKLRCTDPATGKKRKKYMNAARGTECGKNMWCREGRCVRKDSK